MKARFIFAAMAALAIVSCNKNEVETPVTSLEGPSAMMKVNIMSANGMTKAYSDGTAEENKVSKVEFYFYDAAGAAYSVVPGGNSITWTSQDPAGDNIEKISDAVLVIKQAETTPPTQVVAVLNGTESYEGLSLAQLGAKVVKALHKNNTDFVMTNSVYYDGGSADAVVVATQITQDNIFVIADGTNTPGVGEAMELPAGVEPIDIYVERVAAKVKVVGYNPETLVPVKDKSGVQMVDSEGNAVYAQFTGWNVTNATDEAYAVKNLSSSYEFSWAWNDADDFRSFWANTTDAPEHKHSYNTLETHTVGFDYYFENTHATEHSQLLIAARLVDEKGDNISLAQWYNVYYTVADLKTAIANSLKAKVFTKSGNTLYSITKDDVTFYQKPVTDENGATNSQRYEVLVKPTEGVTYYKATTEAYTAEEIAELLASVAPAKMWEEGMTYYYTTIKHIDSNYPALVRNHEYQITITGVKGFGTPVYDPEMIIIPEIPEDQDALNLAAEINVLAWNVITQEVELGF